MNFFFTMVSALMFFGTAAFPVAVLHKHSIGLPLDFWDASAFIIGGLLAASFALVTLIIPLKYGTD